MENQDGIRENKEQLKEEQKDRQNAQKEPKKDRQSNGQKGGKSIMTLASEKYRGVKAEEYIGIFGNPIAHTLSPVIHDTLSALFGLDIKYIPFHVERDLDFWVKAAFEQGIKGLNITVPYKQDVMRSLAQIDPAVEAIGAVNTLVRVNGGYKGFNTDMPGLARAIFSEGMEIKDRKIIMFGAGGAARAVAYMCMHYGAKKVYILNRTYEKAKQIADDMNALFHKDVIVPLAADSCKTIPKDRYLFLQCTSIGLHEGDGLPLVTDEEFYRMADAAVDLIYNPAETPFLKTVKKCGGKTLNGLKMLLYQGIMAYELWTGKKVSEEDAYFVYQRLCGALYKKNIILIGYMGSGKTAVGTRLAEMMGYDFLDTDAFLVEKTGRSISDIFAKEGEESFRKLETEMLKELSQNLTNTVISTGGGLPLRRENAKLLQEIGRVYYLCAGADTIYERVKGDTGRPLLAVEDPYGRICEMLTQRDPVYQSASDRMIFTDGKEICVISEEIKTDFS